MDRIDEEEWRKIEELWEEKVPLLRICGRNAKRAKMACEVQAKCGEHGIWGAQASAESEALKRSTLKSAYKCSELKGKHLWRNSDKVNAAITSWGGSISERSIGQTIGDAMIMELETRGQDSLERMLRHGREIQLEPDHTIEHASADRKCCGEVSCKELKREWVIKARIEETDEMRKHRIHRKVPGEEFMRESGKARIKVRDKGEENNPEYRSRLVTQEIKKVNRQDLFAATPKGGTMPGRKV